MGTKKGQMRKTARRAYEPRKTRKLKRKASFYRRWLDEMYSTKSGKKQLDAAFKRMEKKRNKGKKR